MSEAANLAWYRAELAALDNTALLGRVVVLRRLERERREQSRQLELAAFECRERGLVAEYTTAIEAVDREENDHRAWNERQRQLLTERMRNDAHPDNA